MSRQLVGERERQRETERAGKSMRAHTGRDGRKRDCAYADGYIPTVLIGTVINKKCYSTYFDDFQMSSVDASPIFKPPPQQQSPDSSSPAFGDTPVWRRRRGIQHLPRQRSFHPRPQPHPASRHITLHRRRRRSTFRSNHQFRRYETSW